MNTPDRPRLPPGSLVLLLSVLPLGIQRGDVGVLRITFRSGLPLALEMTSVSFVRYQINFLQGREYMAFSSQAKQA